MTMTFKQNTIELQEKEIKYGLIEMDMEREIKIGNDPNLHSIRDVQ